MARNPHIADVVGVMRRFALLPHPRFGFGIDAAGVYVDIPFATSLFYFDKRQ